MTKEKTKPKKEAKEKEAVYEWKNDRTLSYTMRQRKMKEEKQDGSN